MASRLRCVEIFRASVGGLLAVFEQREIEVLFLSMQIMTRLEIVNVE
jgi:hypothetical protein